ncbi:MAG: polysaccharide deacetylase family protein [Lachnospiraceae bacterium]|nr:polysaccharide deacetylase family protein [Lachnospiraceae bacterium]
MREKVNEFLDSLIAAHQIEEKKIPGFDLSRVVKPGIFLLALLVLLSGVVRLFPEAIGVGAAPGERKLPIYCVETDEPKISLSFDAAWGNEDTAQILEILQKHDVKVTFFMTGGWVENYPEDVKAILAAGHDLGNHSENHKNMSQISNADKKEELMEVHNKVKELTDYEMFLFRPPYGDYDNAVVEVAQDCGYYTIQWDVDSLDWKDYGVDSIIKTVTEHKHLGNGSIILCHNGAKYTAQALDVMITTLKEKGYSFVPISELIYKEKYHMNHEGRQIADQ